MKQFHWNTKNHNTKHTKNGRFKTCQYSRFSCTSSCSLALGIIIHVVNCLVWMPQIGYAFVHDLSRTSYIASLWPQKQRQQPHCNNRAIHYYDFRKDAILLSRPYYCSSSQSVRKSRMSVLSILSMSFWDDENDDERYYYENDNPLPDRRRRTMPKRDYNNSPKFREPDDNSRQQTEQELRRMSNDYNNNNQRMNPNGDIILSYSDDEDDDYFSSSPRNRRRPREEDYYDDDDEEGNFWTNPVGRLDGYPTKNNNDNNNDYEYYYSSADPAPPLRRRRRQPRNYDPDDDDDDWYFQKQSSNTRRRGASAAATPRSTFRSGTPPPPPFFKDFYDKLFWYGFDSDETTSAADKTMFGGTRGKFSGLALVNQQNNMNRRSSSKPPYNNNNNRQRYYENYIDDYNYNDDNEYYDDDENYDYDPFSKNNNKYMRELQRNRNGMKNNNNNDIYEYDEDQNDEWEYEYEEVTYDWQGKNKDNNNYSSSSKSASTTNIDEKDSIYGNDNNVIKDMSTLPPSRDGPNYSYEDEDDIDIFNWEEDNTNGENDSYRMKKGKRMTKGLSRRNNRKWRRRESPVVNFLDNVFGINPEEAELQAKEYDFKLRLNKNKIMKEESLSNAENDFMSRTRTARRKGYAYKYDEEEEDNEYYEDKNFNEYEQDSSQNSEKIDVDDSMDGTTTFSKEQNTSNNMEGNSVEAEGAKKGKENNVIDVEATVTDTSRSKKEKMSSSSSWKNRAEAVERVPPSGIAAWGPQGEIINTDARTYAVMQAKEDLENKEQVVEMKQKMVSEAEAQLILLKADVAYQKKRIAAMASQKRKNASFENDYDVNSRLSSASIRKKLRNLNEEVEDAGRYLRRARGELEMAQEKLDIFQDRHWALLRQFEADEEFRESSSSNKEYGDEFFADDVNLEKNNLQELEENQDIIDFDENKKGTKVNGTATVLEETKDEPTG